jgi:protein-tyrosine phosphatase
VTAALLLALAGVPTDAIAEDYSLSSEYLRPRDEAFIANGTTGTPEERVALVAEKRTRAEVMHEALEHLERRHGGLDRYLLAAGVTPDDIETIRTRLTDDAPATPRA